MRKFFLIVCAAAAVFFSCKKEDTVLGLDVQSENDLLYGSYDESTKVIANTVHDTGLISSLNNLGVYLLGAYQDPVFGRSDAGIFTNFIIKDNITNINTGTKAVMDSVVLTLTYKTDFYGDTTDPLKVNVHLLHPAVELNKDSFYYSGSSYKYESADITESGNGYTFMPRPASKVFVGTDYVKPQLRIRLDSKWFEDNLLLQDAVYLKNTDAMQDIFKGLYITASGTTTFSPSHGSILSFYLYDANTTLTMYYHNLSQSNLKIQFTCGGGTAHFNHFEHDYGTASTALQSQIDSDKSNDTTLGQQNVFVQSMAGLGFKIQLPDLTKYCDSGAIAVARAELVFSVDADPQWETDQYKTPLAFGIRAYTADGKLEDIADYGQQWVGGGYDAANKVYKINIPRHINLVCNGKKQNYGFFIYPAESSSRPYRAVIGGSKHSTLPIKLKLAYTKLYKQ